jgi:LytR cell envelope-related transcriptional attenuator
VESRALRRWIAAGAGLVLAIGLTGSLVMRARAETTGPSGKRGKRPTVVVPQGVRVRVEVLNATKTRGLARRATAALRDRGFDVVGFANSATTRDSTLVLDRSGHPEWAKMVAQAMGGARIESRPDSSRYLDVTVLVGANWRPSTEAFRP